VCLQYFDTVGWVLRPVKNRRPYNLYCVGGDVKPCSINQSINSSLAVSNVSELFYGNCKKKCFHTSVYPFIMYLPKRAEHHPQGNDYYCIQMITSCLQTSKLLWNPSSSKVEKCLDDPTQASFLALLLSLPSFTVRSRIPNWRGNPPSPSCPLLSLPLHPVRNNPLIYRAMGSGELCKLCQRGLEWRPSGNRIWCILALKFNIWWQQFY